MEDAKCLSLNTTKEKLQNICYKYLKLQNCKNCEKHIETLKKLGYIVSKTVDATLQKVPHLKELKAKICNHILKTCHVNLDCGHSEIFINNVSLQLLYQNTKLIKKQLNGKQKKINDQETASKKKKPKKEKAQKKMHRRLKILKQI